jgi:hypothetical protein
MMSRVLSILLGCLVLPVGALFLSGCGERAGSYTFDTTLDESMDAYVHPIKRGTLELSPTPPEGLRGLDRFGGRDASFADLHLGNLTEEHEYLALVEGPDGIEIVEDRNLNLDLSDDPSCLLHPYEEGSPYFLSDTLTIAYPVDTGGDRHRVERKISFVFRKGEDGWLRYEFVGQRTGCFDHLEGGPFAYILFDADNNGFYDHRDLLIVDTNRDGVIDGNRNSVERYTMSEPFLLGERAYKVVGLNRRGIRFSIMPYKGPFTPHDRLEVGEKAPDFTLTDLAGGEVRLSDFSGKTILLPVWASW